MPAINLNASTYGTIGVGGEHDQFTVALVAGQEYEFRLHGFGRSELSDPYLRLYNPSGTLVAQNDDTGSAIWDGTSPRDSRVVFTPPAGGTYTLDVAGFTTTQVGDYLLTAVVANPSGMVFTPDEIAWQLINNGMESSRQSSGSFQRRLR